MVDNTRTHTQWLYVDTILLLKIGFRMFDSKIPALSIREPYATLIMEGKKDIELRSWSAKEGNTFYIHVPVVADLKLCKGYGITPRRPKSIIGKATITRVKYYRTPDEFANDYPRHHSKLFWKYNWGFILSNVEKVEPPIENVPGKRFFFFV
jgi:hypothetical protein